MSNAISPAMVDAGMIALERIQRARPSPAATVAAIYNAMEGAKRREAVKSTTKPEPYVHQSWPAFRYGPNGQSAKFTQESDVPPGWFDSPKKVELSFVEEAREIGAETVADLPSGRRPGRPRKDAA